VSVLEPLRRADPAPSPLVPPATGKAVVRTALLNRLCGTEDGTIVTIVAPAGFGKTTLLAQWAERDRRPVMWLDLEPEDDDPEILTMLSLRFSKKGYEVVEAADGTQTLTVPLPAGVTAVSVGASPK